MARKRVLILLGLVLAVLLMTGCIDQSDTPIVPSDALPMMQGEGIVYHKAVQLPDTKFAGTLIKLCLDGTEYYIISYAPPNNSAGFAMAPVIILSDGNAQYVRCVSS